MNLDVDRFMKDIESMLGSQGRDKQADDDSDGSEGSSMDMNFGNFLVFFCFFLVATYTNL